MIYFLPEELGLVSAHVAAEEAFLGATLPHSHMTVQLKHQGIQLVLIHQCFLSNLLLQQLYLAYSLLCTLI